MSFLVEDVAREPSGHTAVGWPLAIGIYLVEETITRYVQRVSQVRRQRCSPSSGMPEHPPAQRPANRICYFKNEYAVTFGTKIVQTFFDPTPDKARWVVLEAQLLNATVHALHPLQTNSWISLLVFCVADQPGLYRMPRWMSAEPLFGHLLLVFVHICSEKSDTGR